MNGGGRVLHIFRAMNCGGAETAVMNVYRVIRDAGIQFDFAVSTDDPAYYDAEIGRLGGRVLHLPNPKASGAMSYYTALIRLLATAGPFCAVHSHVHSFSGVTLRAASRAGVPVRIAHSHTAGDPAHSPWRQAYRWTMRTLIRRHATHRVAASAAAFVDLFGSIRTSGASETILPNGIDPTLYTDEKSDREGVCRQLGLPRDCVLVGHVGRFAPVKNHKFLLETYRELARIVPRARLVLVGDGPGRPEIESIVRKQGLGNGVDFLGLRPDVPRILSALDLFLFPSLWEGLGLAVVEAQASGTPCLASAPVPREADLGLGLVAFQDLGQGPHVWAEAAAGLLNCRRPVWVERHRALRRHGYDVGDVARSLIRIYCADSSTAELEQPALCV